MAKEVVALRGTTHSAGLSVFTVSESCCHYEARRNAQNEQIADGLLRLTDSNRGLGFGLCYLCPFYSSLQCKTGEGEQIT